MPLLDLSGHGSILLVEDEDAVRLFSARALRSKGYTVHEARNGVEALSFLKDTQNTVDLVITDVVMPQMDGPTFVNELSQLHPHTKVLFISGYTEDTFRDRLKGDKNIRFLSKPFSLQILAESVKNALENTDPLRLAS